MAKLALTALLATSTALVAPVRRLASHRLHAVDEATALLEQAAALRAEADALAAEERGVAVQRRRQPASLGLLSVEGEELFGDCTSYRVRSIRRMV